MALMHCKFVVALVVLKELGKWVDPRREKVRNRQHFPSFTSSNFPFVDRTLPAQAAGWHTARLLPVCKVQQLQDKSWERLCDSMRHVVLAWANDSQPITPNASASLEHGP